MDVRAHQEPWLSSWHQAIGVLASAILLHMLVTSVPGTQVPFYAATLARARLQRAQERLAESLRDVVERADAWPPARVLLLLKLFATVFPASGGAEALHSIPAFASLQC